jgi:uncharacterized protein YfdQ (DUF2303 family)
MTSDTQDLKLATELGAALSEVRHVESTPFLLVPNDMKVQSLENLMAAPLRKKGTRQFKDSASFIHYVNKHKDGTTSLTYSIDPPKFLATINDHGENEPGWRDHTALYDCPLSKEWRTWTGQDGDGMSQTNFAKFIEDNLPDVATPPAADMLEISRTLEAKKAVNFKSGIRLSDGKNEFTYEEDIKGTAANGRLSIPEEFTIGIPVLEGGPRYAVQARLRYRIQDAKLVMWFDLVRPHKILEDAINEVRNEIAQATELYPLHSVI